MMAPHQDRDLLQGTLDLLVLRTLSLQPLHGYGVVRRLTQVTRGAFRFNAGSVFPALYRLEREGFLDADWGETENRRRAKYYSLTRAGRKKLAEERRHWTRASLAIERVLEGG
jgi:PadR family transcriptional regulator PadR